MNPTPTSSSRRTRPLNLSKGGCEVNRLSYCAIVLFTGFVLLGLGCAQRAANQRVAEYEEMMAPLVNNATREEIVQRFGAPQQRETIGSLEVWTYHMSYGVRGGAYVSPYNQYGTYATARSHEVYDHLTMTFSSSGRLTSWRVYVQR
jgi:hypothetical protein